VARGCMPIFTATKAIKATQLNWYGRAGKPVCREPLDAEWRKIVADLLG
jgi:hypothetical protein